MAKKKKAGRPIAFAGGEVVRLRVDAGTVARLDALAARMEGGEACLIYGGQVSRSSALRYALLAGLGLLEKARSARGPQR